MVNEIGKKTKVSSATENVSLTSLSVILLLKLDHLRSSEGKSLLAGHLKHDKKHPQGDNVLYKKLTSL